MARSGRWPSVGFQHPPHSSVARARQFGLDYWEPARMAGPHQLDRSSPVIDERESMALPQAIRTTVQWRTFAPPRRLPLGGVVPLSDALALAGALAPLGHLTVPAVVYAALAYALLRTSGTHDSRINPRFSDDLAGLLGRLALPLLLLAPFVATDRGIVQVLRMAPLFAALAVAGRVVSYKLIREARARGFVVEPTLIVGAGSLGVQVAQTIQEHAEFGLYPMGFLDSFDDKGLPLPILGDVRELEPVIREFGIQRVIVAFGGAREPEMVKILRACDQLPVEVHVVPRFFELGVGPAEGPYVDDLWGIPLMRLRRAALRTVAWRTKRVFDVAVASLMLAVAAPVIGLCALAVRLSGPGPILFRQKRIGQRGQIFELLKF